MDYVETIIPYIFVGAFAIIGSSILFSIFSIFSPKMKGKMMARQVKAAKYMYDEIEDDLRDISNRSADIAKTGIRIRSKAFKDGFSDTNDDIYCKHCGALIDDDSIYCKNCGKKQ